MKTALSLVLITIALLSGSLCAATIYECRAYNGSTFLANNYCSQHNAIGVLNHTVPDGLPFDQQVKIVNSAKAKEAARRQDDEARWTQSSVDNSVQAKELQCKQLDREIATKDSELRQPHSAQWGDALTEARRKLMDRRFELRC